MPRIMNKLEFCVIKSVKCLKTRIHSRIILSHKQRMDQHYFYIPKGQKRFKVYVYLVGRHFSVLAGTI
jgi:hypothetical protein